MPFPRPVPWLITLLSAASCFASSRAAESSESRQPIGLVELKGGDFLRGRIVSVGDGQLRWLHEFTNTTLTLPITEAKRISFSVFKPTQASTDNLWLRGGDQISGLVKAVDTESVEIVSNSLGSLKFARKDVAGVALREKESDDGVIIDGSLVESDWEFSDVGEGSSELNFKDGKLTIEGTFWEPLKRKVTLPDSYILETKIAWKDSLDLRIDIGAPEKIEDDTKATSLFLHIQDKMVRLQRLVAGNQSGRAGAATLAQVRGLTPFIGDQRHFTLRCYVNRLKGDCAIYINGKFAAKSNGPLIDDDSLDIPSNGSMISIYHRTQSAMRISTFALSQWDGRKIPSRPNLTPRNDDHIYFEHGDNTRAEIIGLRRDEDGQRILRAKIPFSDKEEDDIPDPFIDYFSFADLEPSKTEDENEVTPQYFAYLSDGSALSLNTIETDDNGAIVGELATGYKVSIPASSINELLFTKPLAETDTDEPEE